MKARASRTAINVASVPEEVKRTRSADGTSVMTALGPVDLGLVAGAVMGAALDLRCTAATTFGMAMAEQQRAVAAEIVDIAIAVDIPFPRPLGAGDVQPVGLDVAGIMRDAAREQPGGLSAAAAEPGVAAR